jgi:hypothetical protein
MFITEWILYSQISVFICEKIHAFSEVFMANRAVKLFLYADEVYFFNY